MVSRAGGQDWVPGESIRCAFCLQRVDASFPTACPRCRALYHRDCWKANDSRCAVYGCERVAPPAPAVPAARPAPRPGGGGFWSWSRSHWGIIIYVALVVSNLGRLHSNSGFSSQGSPRSGGDRIGAPADPWTVREARMAEAQGLIEETRPLLAELESQTDLPADPALRWALGRRVESAVDKLVRARQICLRYGGAGGDPQGRLLRAASEDLARLQKVRLELLPVRH